MADDDKAAKKAAKQAAKDAKKAAKEAKKKAKAEAKANKGKTPEEIAAAKEAAAAAGGAPAEGAAAEAPAEAVEYELGEDGKPLLDENGQPIPKKKKSKKKLIIIILLVLVLLGGAGAGAWFMGLIPHGGEGGVSEEEAALTAPQITYFDLDPFTVNLNNPGKQVSFLKMTVTLELPNLATKAAVEAKMPRIRDSFQVYLRELRNSDLQGSAGVHRLREELLLRINKAIEPDKINDILFKEIIVQ